MSAACSSSITPRWLPEMTLPWPGVPTRTSIGDSGSPTSSPTATPTSFGQRLEAGQVRADEVALELDVLHAAEHADADLAAGAEVALRGLLAADRRAHRVIAVGVGHDGDAGLALAQRLAHVVHRRAAGRVGADDVAFHARVRRGAADGDAAVRAAGDDVPPRLVAAPDERVVGAQDVDAGLVAGAVAHRVRAETGRREPDPVVEHRRLGGVDDAHGLVGADDQVARDERVVGRPEELVRGHEHAVGLVADHRQAGRVAADVVAVHEVRDRAGAGEQHAVPVAADRVAGRGRRAADRRLDRVLDVEPDDRQRQRVLAERVQAEVVALHERGVRTRQAELDAREAVDREPADLRVRRADVQPVRAHDADRAAVTARVGDRHVRAVDLHHGLPVSRLARRRRPAVDHHRLGDGRQRPARLDAGGDRGRDRR